ncbi:hypothetical protein cand_003250 [Cryptosporidium andersoni]|uniref:Uncharacterized protein n=1 Tax=Cryptosporidium andersoni TaxID=117008 RepID=A0A1J4MKE9_9CRYT|nr:hypothetical protein cand_003250 [Cryptosporidium andersoni]
MKSQDNNCTNNHYVTIIDFSKELDEEQKRIFKKVFVHCIKKYDKFHNGIVTAENFCNSIRDVDVILRSQDNPWKVHIEGPKKCSVSCPALIPIMNLVKITGDKYVNCKLLYLDVERMESVVKIKSSYDGSSKVIAHIKKRNLEKDSVSYLVNCPEIFLQDLYPPALYPNTHKHDKFNNIIEERNKKTTLRALAPNKLSDFRKLYSMWDRCMLSDSEFFYHMSANLGIVNIPEEFKYLVATKGPSRTLSFKDAICTLFINDIDSQRRYRKVYECKNISDIPIETFIENNKDININIEDKEIKELYNNEVNKLISNYNINKRESLDKGYGTEIYLQGNPIINSTIEDNNNYIDNLIKDKSINTQNRVNNYPENSNITIIPEDIKLILRNCVDGQTSSNVVRYALNLHGIPITTKLDLLLRRNDDGGTTSFTSFMKEIYKSIKR